MLTLRFYNRSMPMFVKKLLYRKVHFLKSNQLNCNTQGSKIVDSYGFVADPIGENLQLSHRSPYWVRTEGRKGKNGKGEKGKGKVVLPPYLTHFNHWYPIILIGNRIETEWSNTEKNKKKIKREKILNLTEAGDNAQNPWVVPDCSQNVKYHEFLMHKWPRISPFDT